MIALLLPSESHLERYHMNYELHELRKHPFSHVSAEKYPNHHANTLARNPGSRRRMVGPGRKGGAPSARGRPAILHNSPSSSSAID